MKQVVCALTALVVFCGNVSATQKSELFGPETVPTALQPYMTDGAFNPSDYGWMRGRFPEASDKEKAAYRAIADWREGCSQAEKQRVRAQLAQMGHANVSLDNLPVTSKFCDQFAVEPSLGSYESFDQFQSALVTTLPIFDALIASIDLAEIIAHRHRRSFAENIGYRKTGEQMARSAFSWLGVPKDTPRVPVITDEQRPMFLALLSAEIGRRDRTNTEWLKAQVAENGWPTISSAGKDVSGSAWLLAQHADHDPVWQLQVLRMMEPLMKDGEVSRSNYAYLYDRVMLKLTGKQRYGSQLTCENGERIALPLEDKAQLDKLRGSVDLNPFAEYLMRFSEPCPKGE